MRSLERNASWVIVRRDTGEAVLELFTSACLGAINREKYDVVPILAYLQELNRKIRLEEI